MQRPPAAEARRGVKAQANKALNDKVLISSLWVVFIQLLFLGVMFRRSKSESDVSSIFFHEGQCISIQESNGGDLIQKDFHLPMDYFLEPNCYNLENPPNPFHSSILDNQLITDLEKQREQLKILSREFNATQKQEAERQTIKKNLKDWTIEYFTTRQVSITKGDLKFFIRPNTLSNGLPIIEVYQGSTQLNPKPDVTYEEFFYYYQDYYNHQTSLR